MTTPGLKELAERATPGPWFDDSYKTVHSASASEEYGRVELELDQAGAADEVYDERLPKTQVSWTRMDADAAYIAAANPQAILDLLAENERLREALRVIAEKDGSIGAARNIAHTALAEAIR